MNALFICPDCQHEVEVLTGCGSVSYYCHTCKKLVSSKKVIRQEKKGDATPAVPPRTEAP